MVKVLEGVRVVEHGTFITGPAQHLFTTPLDEAKKLFRVEVFPDYLPVTSD